MPPVRERSRSITTLLPVTAPLALALVALGCSSTMGLPESATTQGDSVVEIWRVFLVLAALVAGLIYVLTCYVIISSLRRRRRANAGEASATASKGLSADSPIPRQHQYNTRLEIFYTAVPLLLVGFLFVFSFSRGAVLTDTQPKPDLNITVLGYQWGWQFIYPDHNVTLAGDPTAPPTLMLPVGRTVHFTIKSNDVIHSFWVPDFLEKRDMVPGVVNNVDVNVKAPGEWTGRCAEYCGFNHWMMTFRAQAVPADEFDRWLSVASTRPQPIVAAVRAVTSTSSSTAVPITAAPPTVTNPPITARDGTTVVANPGANPGGTTLPAPTGTTRPGTAP
jgi:cytochrome c oxidase subunit 2